MVQGWAKAQRRERFGEGKRGFALTAAFSAPLSRAGTSPPDPGGLFYWERVRGQGAFGACTNLSPHEDTFIAPHAPRQEQSLCTLG